MTDTQHRGDGPRSTEFVNALSPFQLKGLRLRNRVFRASQGTMLTLGGRVTPDLIAWTVERARGGVAMSYVDMGGVHWSSPGLLDLTTDGVIPGLSELVDAAHAEGTLIFQQLLHGGPTNLPLDGSAPWAASGLPDPGLGALAVPMTTMMIDEIVESFATAAARAQAAGVDGLEIHAGHGYLFSSFLSPATNQRDDEYGGTLENRSRLLLEVLNAVRGTTGADYVLGVRLSPDGPPEQTTVDDLIEVVRMLERQGVIDFLSTSLGSHYQRDLLMGTADRAPGYQLGSSEKLTSITSLPTMVTGRVTSLAQADEIVGRGVADLISMVRATIADPYLVAKSMAGAADDVRPCIFCNQACAGGLASGRVACVVNPGAGQEVRWGDHRIERGPVSRVVVIGGGPGGMEAARTAAMAGHQVTLFEAADALGGQLRVLARTPNREAATELLPWYERQMGRFGVDVHVGAQVGVAEVQAVHPDVVVLATGAVPRREIFQTWAPGAQVLGIGHDQVVTGWEVLEGAVLGRVVLVVDEISHYESMDVLETLTARGHDVHLVTRFNAVGSKIEVRWDMVSAPFWARFQRAGGRLYARTVLSAVDGGVAQLHPVDALELTTEVAFDDLVVMSGSVPDFALRGEFAEAFPELRVIGDVNGPRGLHSAITEGHVATRAIAQGRERPLGLRFGQSGSAI